MRPALGTPKRLVTCALLALVGIATGCAVGPDFVRPALPESRSYLPDRTRHDAPDLNETGNLALSESLSHPPQWWRALGSVQLDALVEQALDHNPSLQAARATLARSQNALRSGQGVFYPQVGLGLTAQRERSAPLQLGSPAPGSIFSLVTLSSTITYALDVFGERRRTVEGLAAQVDEQRQITRGAAITLVANVINTAIARMAYHDELVLIDRMLALQLDQLSLIQTQRQSGLLSASTEATQQSLIATTRANRSALLQRLRQAEHLLAILTGNEPSHVFESGPELAALALPSPLPLALPSQLVRQRPDILAAEAQLHQASAALGVATAATFPSFTLSAGTGALAPNLSSLNAASQRFWTVGPSVSVPLFTGGTLDYARQAAAESLVAAQAAYRGAVLAAFAQVADTLTALANDSDQLSAQASALDAALDNARLAQAALTSGLGSYLDTMALEITALQARTIWLQALALRHQDTVALFTALGGGWDDAQLAVHP